MLCQLRASALALCSCPRGALAAMRCVSYVVADARPMLHGTHAPREFPVLPSSVHAPHHCDPSLLLFPFALLFVFGLTPSIEPSVAPEAVLGFLSSRPSSPAPQPSLSSSSSSLLLLPPPPPFFAPLFFPFPFLHENAHVKIHTQTINPPPPHHRGQQKTPTPSRRC